MCVAKFDFRSDLKSNFTRVKTLVGLRDKPYPVRAFTLLRHRVFKNGLVRNLGTLAINEWKMGNLQIGLENFCLGNGAADFDILVEL